MNNENTDNTVEKQSKPWQFKPGECPNPNGRPKGAKNYLTLLEKALKEYEKETGKKLFKRTAGSGKTIILHRQDTAVF